MSSSQLWTSSTTLSSNARGHLRCLAMRLIGWMFGRCRTSKHISGCSRPAVNAQAELMGPLDIHAPPPPPLRRLLLLYMCTRKCIVNTILAEKYDQFAAIKCAWLRRYLPKPGQKTLDPWLVSRSFASTFMRYCKVSHIQFVPYCQRVLQRILKQQKGLHPMEQVGWPLASDFASARRPRSRMTGITSKSASSPALLKLPRCHCRLLGPSHA